MPIKLSTFYEAKRMLDNYDQAVTLYGIRRTGKTVVMNQLWNEVKTSNSMYILATGSINILDLANLVLKSKLDYLFIDEVTKLDEFQTEIHSLLDVAHAMGTKLVLAGTESYLIALSRQSSALGRLSLLRFIPTSFSDLKLIDNSVSFKDFCDNGISITKENFIDDLIFTVMESIDKSYHSNQNPLSMYNKELYKYSIQTIIEYVIGVMSNTIKAPKYVLSGPSCEIQSSFIKNSSLDVYGVSELFSILCEIDIIKPMRRFNLDSNGDSMGAQALFYSTVPAMYKSYIKNITRKLTDEERYKMSGVVFESTAITQVLKIIEDFPDTYDAYSIRGSGVGYYEVDMCIEKKNGDDTRTISLIEFKRSKSRTSRHFGNEHIINYSNTFEKVNRYIVYAVDNKEFDSNIPRVYIEDFLSNLEEYLS